MSKSKSSSYQSLSPTPSTSPSISPGQSSSNNQTLTTAEVIKLLRQSGPSEVADYLERRQRTKPKHGTGEGMMRDDTKIRDCIPHECPDCGQECLCCDRMCSHPETAECGVSRNWQELPDYR